MLHVVGGMQQGPAQLLGCGPVVLQEVKGHALGRLLTHPGQAAQGGD